MPFQEFCDRLLKFGDKTVTHSRTERGRGATVLSRSRSILRAVAEPFHVLPLGKACKRSSRLIQKSRDAAAIINIAAKNNRDRGGIARHWVGPFRYGSSVKQPEALAHHGHRQVEHHGLINL
jgi:hypothetical protein